MTMQSSMWTTPYFGVQHTPKDKHGRRCSVQDNKQWAELHMWFEDCGFSPRVSHHDTVEEARATGERWLKNTTHQPY